MNLLLRLLILVLGELLFVRMAGSLEATTSGEIELFNSLEINFHKFLANYVSNLRAIRPASQPEANFNRPTVKPPIEPTSSPTRSVTSASNFNRTAAPSFDRRRAPSGSSGTGALGNRQASSSNRTVLSANEINLLNRTTSFDRTTNSSSRRTNLSSNLANPSADRTSSQTNRINLSNGLSASRANASSERPTVASSSERPANPTIQQPNKLSKPPGYNQTNLPKNPPRNVTGMSAGGMNAPSSVSISPLDTLSNITASSSPISASTPKPTPAPSVGRPSSSTSKPTGSINVDLNQIVYTPKECGRSFDEDFVEGELNKFALYSSSSGTRSLISGHNEKMIGPDNKAADRRIVSEARSELESAMRRKGQPVGKNDESKSDTGEHSSNIKSINKRLDSLAERADDLSVNLRNETKHYYSENANLNLESLIKNFNFSTSNETDLQMLKSALTNRDEYYHYGEKRIINGKRFVRELSTDESFTGNHAFAGHFVNNLGRFQILNQFNYCPNNRRSKSEPRTVPLVSAPVGKRSSV